MSGRSGGSFATLTHARLRAAQGDIGGAVRILRVILNVQPEHEDAKILLVEIENRVSVVHREPGPQKAEPVRPATAGDLKNRFRAALGADSPTARAQQLRRWLEGVQSRRGARHVR